MKKESDIVIASKPVVDALDKLNVRYYISGSVASSIYGLARATMDVDMLSELKKNQVHHFVEMLENEFYIDEEMILDAIETQSSFNLIHLGTMLKIDIFISKNEPYDLESLGRRKKDTLDKEQSAVSFYIVSPEDIILRKLEWFNATGGQSERQWRDILGVLKVQKGTLDVNYLQKWANNLKIYQILEKAFREAGYKL